MKTTDLNVDLDFGVISSALTQFHNQEEGRGLAGAEWEACVPWKSDWGEAMVRVGQETFSRELQWRINGWNQDGEH